MKKYLVLVILAVLTSCGGDIGSSKTSVEQQNVFNPDPASCSISCENNVNTGIITGTKNCTSGTVETIPNISTLDACDSVNEVTLETTP